MRAVVAVLLCVTAAHAALWGVLREKQEAPDFRGKLPSVSYAPFEGSGHPDVDNIPSVEKIRSDLKVLAPLTARSAFTRRPAASKPCHRSPPNSAWR